MFRYREGMFPSEEYKELGRMLLEAVICQFMGEFERIFEDECAMG